MRPMLRAALIALALPLALLVAFAPRTSARGEDPPPPLRVRGVDVPWAEYAAWLVREHGAAKLEDYLRTSALERAAASFELSVSEEAVEERMRADTLARVARTFGGNVEAWRAELARLGTREELYYQDRFGETRQALLLDALARHLREPDEPTLRAEWRARYGQNGRSLELELLHLRADPPLPPQGATRDEVRALDRAARELVRQRSASLREAALAGEPFAELVRRHSEDPDSRVRGGRLEGEAEVSYWIRTVRDAVQGLAEGELSEPLWSRGGWNLFRAARVIEVPFESARAELLQTFRERPASSSETAAVLERFAGWDHVELLPELGLPHADGRARLDEPVALVDGQTITRRELGRWLLATHGVALARAYAERRAIEDLAREQGIVPSADELEQRLREDELRLIELFHKGDPEAFARELAARGKSLADWRRDAAPRSRHELLAERLLRASGEITRERLIDAWQERYGPGGRNPRVRFLLRAIPAPEEPLETPEEIERYMQTELERLHAELSALRARILADGLDFATLARRLSEDPLTRERGGEPDGRFRLHTWPEHVQQALLALGPGELSEPLDVAGGLVFLFELEGIVEVPFESVEAELRAELEAARPSRTELASFAHRLVSEGDFEILLGLRAGQR